MIASDIFDKFKEERKKIGFKRTYTRGHKIIIRALAILDISSVILLLLFKFILNNNYLILIAIGVGVFLFLCFAVLIDIWDITDYDVCNDKLVHMTKYIILNAIKRLKEKSDVSIGNTETFIDYVIDYVKDLGEKTRKKQELVLKVLTIIVFPIILGVAYSLFNQLDTKELLYILLAIVIASISILFLIVELYDVFFLSSRKKYINQNFLQVLNILKSSTNLNLAQNGNVVNKNEITTNNKEILQEYLKDNKVITIKKTQELFSLSYYKASIFLNRLNEERFLNKYRIKNQILFELCISETNHNKIY